MDARGRLEIRRARPADATALTKLTEQLGYPSSLQAIVQRLGTLLDLPEHALLVATRAGAVRGWVHVHTAHRLESEACAEIGGLVVDATCRGQGVGTSLVRAAEGWARTQGLPVVRVRSNVVRTEAHRFYEKLGYASLKRSALFARTLEPQE